MTIEFILSQVFICVSACIYSTSLILKTKQKMLMLQMCSSIFFISHYFLLDEKLAGFVAVLETIRLLAFFYLDKHEKHNTTLTRSITCIIFSVLSVIAAIFTWNSIYCLLPLIATIFVNITLSFKNVIFYKVGAMIYAILIINFLFLIGSIVGGISQCVAFVFSVIGLILGFKNKTDNQNSLLSPENQQLLKTMAKENEINTQNKKISQ